MANRRYSMLEFLFGLNKVKIPFNHLQTTFSSRESRVVSAVIENFETHHNFWQPLIANLCWFYIKVQPNQVGHVINDTWPSTLFWEGKNEAYRGNFI